MAKIIVVTEDPNLLRCRYCGWKTRRIYAKKGGRVVDGWRRLATHVAEEHWGEEELLEQMREEGKPELADELEWLWDACRGGKE